jgi:hypothetical protein
VAWDLLPRGQLLAETTNSGEEFERPGGVLEIRQPGGGFVRVFEGKRSTELGVFIDEITWKRGKKN